ncbi:MAG: hypothetical protein ACTHN5_08520 [Phycisphaerae bacterium]
MSKVMKRYGMPAVALLILATAAGAFVMNWPRSPKVLTSAYFVDEATGEETVRPMSDIPPLKGAGGGETVVREFKYTEDGRATVKVAYYIKYTPETQAKLQGMKTQEERDQYDATEGTLVRSPAPGSKWVEWGSPEGQEITTIHPGEGKDFAAVFP